MITGVAFCPQAPALVPGIGRGLDAELGELRDACGRAVRAVVGETSSVVVLGPGPRSQFHARFARGHLDGFGPAVEVQLGGASCGGGAPLGPALSVGTWALHGLGRRRVPAYGYTVGPDWSDSSADDFAAHIRDQDVAVVVAGDGSACRSEKAPGHLDARSGPFDATVARILAGGDAASLASLDPALGAELSAAGVPAWRALGRALVEQGSSWTADLLVDDAPFGVGYFVASWTRA